MTEENDKDEPSIREKRWKLVEKFAIPAILALMAVQAVWYLVLEPKTLRMAAQDDSASEDPYPDDPGLSIGDAVQDDEETARTVPDNVEPATFEFAGRVIAIAVLLKPDEADAAIRMLDEPAGGSAGPRAISISREYRHWIPSGNFDAAKIAPNASAQVRGAIQNADGQCRGAITAKNLPAYKRALNVLQQQLQGPTMPPWNPAESDGMTAEFILRPAYQALLRDGPLLGPDADWGAPEWCHAP